MLSTETVVTLISARTVACSLCRRPTHNDAFCPSCSAVYLGRVVTPPARESAA